VGVVMHAGPGGVNLGVGADRHIFPLNRQDHERELEKLKAKNKSGLPGSPIAMLGATMDPCSLLLLWCIVGAGFHHRSGGRELHARGTKPSDAGGNILCDRSKGGHLASAQEMGRKQRALIDPASARDMWVREWRCGRSQCLRLLWLSSRILSRAISPVTSASSQRKRVTS
jgi:hypothetical protein